MLGAQNSPPMDEDPVGPRHRVARGPVGYKHGMRDGMGPHNNPGDEAGGAAQGKGAGRERPLALLGHALKLLVSTCACCHVLGPAHTFIHLLSFLSSLCSRALFLFTSLPLSHALCVAFAYLVSSPLLFVWGTHTSSYSYACSLPPFSSFIQSIVLHSCRTLFMCDTKSRHRGERRGELATGIPA